MNHKPISNGIRRIELLLIFFPAMIALVFSAFWLINSARSWQAYQIEWLLINGHQVAPETLMKTLEEAWGLEKAVIPGRHLHAPAMLAANLNAKLYLGQALDDKILIGALESAQHALAREPADECAWAQLAYFRYLMDGPSPGALDALRMSIYISPFGKELVFWRLEMAALNRAFWDDQMVDLISRQIIIAWSIDPVMLAKTAIFYDLAPITKSLLSAYPEQLMQLDALISEHEPQRISP